jgi:hypothetical protein
MDAGIHEIWSGEFMEWRVMEQGIHGMENMKLMEWRI